MANPKILNTNQAFIQIQNRPKETDMRTLTTEELEIVAGGDRWAGTPKGRAPASPRDSGVEPVGVGAMLASVLLAGLRILLR